MATSVKFNGTEICNSTYIPRYVQHESAPERDLSLLQLAREDGAVFISEKYGSKTIIVMGKLTASSRSNLETAIDNFKSLFGNEESNLDISWAGSTRRYVATCMSHNFNRDYFHDLFVPWTARFVVAKGIGKDTSESAAIDAYSFKPTKARIVTFAGSAKPLPTITLTIGSGWSSAYGIKFENTDKDEEIIVNYSTGFTEDDEVIIDCENKKVTINGTEIAFYRVFPTFDIGDNNIEIKAGGLIDQQYVDEDNEEAIGALGEDAIANGSDYPAQSFSVPHTDNTYQGLMVRVGRGATIANDDVDIEIQTDDGGKPSGTPVTNATFSIPKASLNQNYTWMLLNSTNKFELSANTLYWIVIMIDGDSANTFCGWATVEKAGSYGRGYAAHSDDAGSTWTDYLADDRQFKLLFGGKVDSPGGNITLDIDYYKRYL